MNRNKKVTNKMQSNKINVIKQHITVDGIEIEVQRKKIKNMYIRILSSDGTVKVTAPYRFSDQAIMQFVNSRIDWIKKHSGLFTRNKGEEKLCYISGEIHYLWGKPYLLEVIETDKKNSIFIKEDKIILQVKKGSTQNQKAFLMQEWYRRELKRVIPEVLDKCIKRVGKAPNEWHVKNMKTRWGTCNIQKKRIWLNLQLAKRPIECLEYVITHELVHLYEKGHNAKFRAYMDQFYPNWKNVKKKLNE